MIYGIGLPRTGTRSLATCLEILGFSGSHYCVLLGGDKSTSNTDSFIVNNEFYNIIGIDESFVPSPNDKYILTTRNYTDWRLSISNWPFYDGPDIYEYEYEIRKKFINDSNLLIFDITKGWESLCNFLNVDIPSVNIPEIR